VSSALWPGRRPTPCHWPRSSQLDAVRQRQISRPDVGRSRAVRVQQAGVKTDHSQPRQIGPRSVDGGSVSDSQADSAGSIPVTRSTREKRCSRTELEALRPLPMRVSGPRAGHFGPHLSTPLHSPFRFRGRSACSAKFSGCSVLPSSNLTEACLRKCERDLNGLNYSVAKINATSDPVQRRRVGHRGARPVDHPCTGNDARCYLLDFSRWRSCCGRAGRRSS